jgi:DNA-binding SARP family transcriptional activator/tetratricopeptide (TPR) repeat protein
MQFRILGSLEVLHDGRIVRVGGTREHLLLARLLLSPNRTVSQDQLLEDVWDGNPPPGALQSLWVQVSRLRKGLRQYGGADELVTCSPGYVLRVEADDIDAQRFETAVASARQLVAGGDTEGSRRALREALALWRGPVLADLADAASFVRAEATRLEETRLAALEDRIELDLASGGHADLVGELETLTIAHPLRERFWSHRMLALYRSSRQAEALHAYQELRRLLAEDLGIHPTDAIRRLEAAILRQDPALDWPPPDREMTPRPSKEPIEPRTPAPKRPANVPLPLPLQRASSSPFVGRAPEMSRLRAAWQTACSGDRQLELMAGDPGIGKTRLAAEIARQVHAQGATVLFGRCDQGMAVSYQPFVEALGTYVRETRVAVLGHLAGELVRLVPEITERLGSLPPPLRSDPETEQYRVFEAVAGWLAAVSVDSPVLLVLDDLHWATRPTLLLLRHLVSSAQSSRLLIVATYRDLEPDMSEDLADTVAGLFRHPGVDLLPLKGLQREGVGEFLEVYARDQLDDAGRALAETLHAETGGNPFFVGQVVRHLVETGAIVREQGRWVAERVAAGSGLPDMVRDVINRRLAHLPAETRETLAIGAVLGNHFERDVLVRAVGEAEISTLRALDAAIAGRLVVETSSGRLSFVHALVRAALYEGLPTASRVELHQRAGHAIESVHHAHLHDHLPALASHFTQAGLSENARALDYSARAGSRALDQLAHNEAVTWFRQALDLLDASEDANETRRSELLILLGEAQRRIGDPAHRQTLLDAARLARRLGLPERLADAALATSRGFFSCSDRVDTERIGVLEAALDALSSEPSPRRARLLVNLAAELTFSEEHERRYGLARQALDMARQQGDPATLGHVLAMGYPPALLSGSPTELERGTAELVSVADRLGDPALQYWAALWAAHTALFVGDRQPLESFLDRAEQLAQESGQAMLPYVAALVRSNWNRVAGRLEGAEEWAEKARRIGEAIGYADAGSNFHTQLLCIRYDQGRLVELDELLSHAAGRPGAPRLTRAAFCLALCETDRADEARPVFDALAAEGFADPPVRFGWLYGTAMLAEVCSRLDDRKRAPMLFERLAAHHAVVVTIVQASAGPIAYYLGLLAATLGRHDEAEAFFHEAMTIAQRLGSPGWLARSEVQLAELLLRRGAPEDADQVHRLAAQACTAAEDLGMAGVAEQAKAATLKATEAGIKSSR